MTFRNTRNTGDGSVCRLLTVAVFMLFGQGLQLFAGHEQVQRAEHGVGAHARGQAEVLQELSAFLMTVSA